MIGPTANGMTKFPTRRRPNRLRSLWTTPRRRSSRRVPMLCRSGGAAPSSLWTPFGRGVRRAREAVVEITKPKERRGFASMSPEKQREIASKGGRAAHEKGTAHEWTAEEARNAGRKGGQVSRGGRGRLILPATDSAPVSEPSAK